MFNSIQSNVWKIICVRDAVWAVKFQPTQKFPPKNHSILTKINTNWSKIIITNDFSIIYESIGENISAKLSYFPFDDFKLKIWNSLDTYTLLGTWTERERKECLSNESKCQRTCREVPVFSTANWFVWIRRRFFEKLHFLSFVFYAIEIEFGMIF